MMSANAAMKDIQVSRRSKQRSSADPGANKVSLRSAAPAKAATWWLYLLECADGRTYAGIAVDVEARFAKHVSGKGSKFTRANRPVRILGMQALPTKSDALKAEFSLKQLDRNDKLEWARRWARK
jgi:putative endonuclease